MLKWIKDFIEKHIVSKFPYDDVCWDCNETECNPQKCKEKGIIK